MNNSFSLHYLLKYLFINNFNFEGVFIDAIPYGFGHINDTYAITFKNVDATTHRYILQRINSTIFKDPEALMENIERVTTHIKKKIIKKPHRI